MNKIKLPIAVLSILSAALTAVAVNADHTWGKYHWDISTEQSTTAPLGLITRVSPGWQSSLDIAAEDWEINHLTGTYSVLQNEVIFPPVTESNPNCDPTFGSVEICNDSYGFNGWLGIASIWATRGKSSHITQGTVKVNDTYFSADYSEGFYDSQEWRDFVMCQEVGHTFGLGHQDESFSNANLGTCMDYTSYPDGLGFDADGNPVNDLDNRRPNQHDYDMLTDMYAHLNSTDGGGGDGGGGNGGGRKPKKSNPGDNKSPNNPSEWGQAIRQDAQGRNSVYERTLSNGQILITHVLWAIEANEQHAH